MDEIRFTVYGLPVPKARARTVRRPNGQISSFTPPRTVRWEENIAAQAMPYLPAEPLDCPLAIEAVFYLPRPQSRRKADMLPDRKPDWDNLAKSLTDALEGLFWTNDSRVTDAVIRKRYGTPPRVEVVIRVADSGCDTPCMAALKKSYRRTRGVRRDDNLPAK